MNNFASTSLTTYMKWTNSFKKKKNKKQSITIYLYGIENLNKYKITK